jgi:hypothetical protein
LKGKIKMDLKNSLLIFLGNRIYTDNPDSIGIPCSSDELYSTQIHRQAIQPLFQPEAAKEGVNRARALLIDTKRRNATRHIAYATVPYLLCVFVVFSALNGVVKLSKTDTDGQVQSEGGSTIGSYSSAYINKAKVLVLSPFTSDKYKLARANELATQMDKLQQNAKNKDDLIIALRPLNAEFQSLNGDYIILSDRVNSDAEKIKSQLARGAITQEQFDTQKQAILERKKRLDDSQN